MFLINDWKAINCRNFDRYQEILPIASFDKLIFYILYRDIHYFQVVNHHVKLTLTDLGRLKCQIILLEIYTTLNQVLAIWIENFDAVLSLEIWFIFVHIGRDKRMDRNKFSCICLTLFTIHFSNRVFVIIVATAIVSTHNNYFQSLIITIK